MRAVMMRSQNLSSSKESKSLTNKHKRKKPLKTEYTPPEDLPYKNDLYKMPNELRSKYMKPGYEYVPKYGQKQLGDSILIKWNNEDIQSDYLKHQMDSIDHWTICMARDRIRIRENLFNHSDKYQDLTNQKLPMNLFDSKEFYNDLYDKNSANSSTFKSRQNALNNWKKRLFETPKITKRPLDAHFNLVEGDFIYQTKIS